MAVSKIQGIVRFHSAMQPGKWLYDNVELRKYNGNFFWYSEHHGRTSISGKTRGAALRHARTVWNSNGHTFFLRSI